MLGIALTDRLEMSARKKPAVVTAKKLPRKKAAEKETAKPSPPTAGETWRKHTLPFQEISPLELANLTISMGYADHEDGPEKALRFFSKCSGAITESRRSYDSACQHVEAVLENRREVRALFELDLESPTQQIPVKRILAKLPTAPLRVEGKNLRGIDLWETFLAASGIAAAEGFPGSEVLGLYTKFRAWRASIAANNSRKGVKNLKKKLGQLDSDDGVDLPTPTKEPGANREAFSEVREDL